MNSSSSDSLPDSSSAGMNALATALRTCFRLLLLIMVIAIVLFLRKSFFTVEQHEVGLVLRFGQLAGEVRQPGLHVTLPYPIDEKVRVPQKREQIVQSGDDLWYSVQEGEVAAPPTLQVGVDGYTLTGDMNVLHSRWDLRYSITSPVDYAFSFVETDEADFSETNRFLRLLLNRTVTEVSASLTIDEAWNDRKQFQDLVEERLKKKLEPLNMGVEIEVLPREIAPPRQVSEAFEAATRAGVQSKEIMGQATSFRDRILSTTQSEETRLLSEARSAKAERVRRAESELAYFKQLLPDYQANPSLLKEALFTESMRRIMTVVDDKFIMQDRAGREVRIELNREAKQSSSEGADQ